jgi:hypothetical protein
MRMYLRRVPDDFPKLDRMGLSPRRTHNRRVSVRRPGGRGLDEIARVRLLDWLATIGAAPDWQQSGLLDWQQSGPIPRG